MTTRFANGTKFAFSQVMSAPAIISAISNASPGVATTTAPPAQGDIVVVTSGWPSLSEVPVKAGAVTANSFVLSGVDTTNVVDYPVGEGVGTFVKVSSFVSLSQVLTATLSGGDQNFHDFQFVEDKSSRQRRKPTFKAAMSYAIVCAYDPDLPWYTALQALDAKQSQVVMRETLPGGETIYYYGYVGFNKVPTKELNVNQQVTLTFSINSDPVRYAAGA